MRFNLIFEVWTLQKIQQPIEVEIYNLLPLPTPPQRKFFLRAFTTKQRKKRDKMAEFLFHKGSPTYLQPENADVMNISQFMAQNLRQAPPPLPPPPKHTFEISEGESVEIEKIVAAEKKV